MNIAKKGLVLLSAGGLLIGGLGLVGAQSGGSSDTITSDATTSDAAAQREFGQDGPLQRQHGFGSGFERGHDRGRGGVGGLPFGRVALGTTVTLSFYDTDPDVDGGAGAPTQTLTFVYGQDSEAAFAGSFAEARANASYMTAEVGEQTQTLELPSTDTSTPGTSTPGTSINSGDRHGGVYGALPLRALNEGSSVTATFYDGDPAENTQTLQTLNFTYGQDSEAGFANDFADAAEGAAYVSVTTSPQTYTVDLSAVAEGRDSRQHDQYRGGHRR